MIRPLDRFLPVTLFGPKGLLVFLLIFLWTPPALAEEMVNPPTTVQRSGEIPPYPGSYRIGPEDIVEISVWKNQDLSLTVAVRPDGMISMPLLGDIPAGGETPAELREMILGRLKEYMEDPTVSVIIREIKSRAFFILGEVMRPGKYPLQSETTILQAISVAGGFSQWAEKDRMIVLRKDPEGSKGGRITVRYKEIVSGKLPNANIVLEPGDTVIVP